MNMKDVDQLPLLPITSSVLNKISTLQQHTTIPATCLHQFHQRPRSLAPSLQEQLAAANSAIQAQEEKCIRLGKHFLSALKLREHIPEANATVRAQDEQLLRLSKQFVQESELVEEMMKQREDIIKALGYREREGGVDRNQLN